MLRSVVSCVVALGGILVGSAAAQAPKTGGSAPLQVERAEIMDQRGFERPMVAYTLFVPMGWKTQGEVEYPPPDGCGLTQRINWSAQAGDGIAAVRIIPEEKWSAASFPQQSDGCMHASVSNARQYLEWWVQRNRPGARILHFRPRPDLAEPFQKLAQEGNGMRSWGDAGEVVIAYSQGGKSVNEVISSAGFYILTQFPSMDPNQSMQMLQGMTAPGFAVRAADGKLDLKAVEALRKSIHSAPEWQARMNQVMNQRHQIATESNRQMAEDNRRAAAERAEISANTSRELSDRQMATWQSKNESMDRTQRESIESIRGVETYNDPHYGGTVQLSNQYQHAWQLKDGSYVLTDDVNFDPARALNVEGERLKVAE